MTPPRLQLRGIAKSFGATRALRGVDLTVERGEVHALIGENGAGKSTLMKILSGVHAADAGDMTLDGSAYRPRGPRHALAAGVAMIYQELNLAPHLDAEANILMGAEPRRGLWLDRAESAARARQALARLGHENLPAGVPVGRLSPANQQIVEIARAFLHRPRVLILDEPTSSLTRRDTARLFELIRRLQQEGVSILYISHFLEECQAVADRFTVLRDGSSVAEGRMGEVSTDEIVRRMAGRSLGELYPSAPRRFGPVRLRVENLEGWTGSPRQVSFSVRAGEILGFAGLIGAGRTETLRAVFGLDRVKGGSIELAGPDGSCVRLDGPSHSPRRSLRLGLGMVSENRKEEGLLLSRPVSENLCATRWDRYGPPWWLSPGKVRRSVTQWLQDLQVKHPGVNCAMPALSGGNQQKVALGRLLHHGAPVLLLDEPTRGIDINSKAQLYAQLTRLAEQGLAILIVSSHFPELLGLCHRIGVFRRGRLVEVRDSRDWSEEELMRVALLDQPGSPEKPTP